MAKAKQPLSAKSTEPIVKTETETETEPIVKTETETETETEEYIAMRPLLHNKTTYAIGADVTGLYEGEELERLKTTGAIAKA